MSKDNGVLNAVLGALVGSAVNEVREGAVSGASRLGRELPRALKRKVDALMKPINYVRSGGMAGRPGWYADAPFKAAGVTGGKGGVAGPSNYRLNRRKRKRSKKSRSLKARISAVEKSCVADLSTLVYRNWAGQQIITTAGASAYNSFSVNDAGFIELALAQLRFFDPAVPGTIVTGNGATGTYERRFGIKSSCILEIKNNYQIPVNLEVHEFRANSDTTQTPYTYANTLLNDNSNAGASALLNPLINVKDARGLGEMWKSMNTKYLTLLPGETCTMSASIPAIEYDPSEFDNHAMDYQVDWFSTSYLVGVTGTIGHDVTTSSEIGFTQAGVDCVFKRQASIRYNAGGPALYQTFILNTTTATADIVSQVVVDNQTYSTS